MFDFPASVCDTLLRRPDETVRAAIWHGACTARVAIPHYAANVAAHYADRIQGGLDRTCANAGIDPCFRHLGLMLEFDSPTEIVLFDGEQVLDDAVRDLVARFGPLILRNAAIAGAPAAEFQRNIFPDLRFHVDRGANQPNQYSCYARIATDPVQREPRSSSTVFAANIVAYLQGVREGSINPAAERGMQASYDLFSRESPAPLMGKIILEQRWDAPRGTGEVVVIDNRTVLHSSYYRDPHNRGYPISTRYLF